jgi:hypothetical protein
MRAFISACIAAIAIAVIGALLLSGIQESADQAFRLRVYGLASNAL